MVSMITLGSLVFDKPNLSPINGETSVSDVLKHLQENNHTYVVIECDGVYKGFVSTMELMTEVAFGMFNWEKPNPADYQMFKSSTTPVKNLLKLNPNEQSLYCYEPTELLQEVFGPMSNGIRRVLVSGRDAGKTSFRTLSQMDVICFIASHFSNFTAQTPVNIDDNLKNHGLCTTSDVVVLKSTDYALQGFRTLALQNLIAAPVIDENGKVITTLSASDLRGVDSENLKNVLSSIVDFLKEIRGNISFPVTCKPEDSLKSALAKIITSKVHRLWIVDNESKPVGVLSITDIIRLFKSKSLPPSKCC